MVFRLIFFRTLNIKVIDLFQEIKCSCDCKILKCIIDWSQSKCSLTNMQGRN